MNWVTYWPDAIFLLLLAVDTYAATNASFISGRGWTTSNMLDAREATRKLWYHGFNSYMTYAFPLDELAPLSCTGKGPDLENPANFAFNDVAGNYSLTLIDVLDTFIVLDDRRGFETAVRNVINRVSFDVNTKPQLFEITIRVLGGLLSAHTFAHQTGGPFYLSWYRGQLLDMAHDLGERLLPAFSTPTGIPYARINLRHGVPKGESTESCTAGAGSLMLEFATLSRLTGDHRFEKAAHKAFFALWNRRSDIGLVGNTINILDGIWGYPEITGIGAGVDSFYEYAFKWYVLSGDVEFLGVFLESYSAIMRYARAKDGFVYRPVNIHTGEAALFSVDALSAFWPGLQVLAGDVQNAIKAHQMYWNIWRRHSGLPENWDYNLRVASSWRSPLRPEFAESTWYLYRATRDPFYLDVGRRILSDITNRSKVECGLAAIKDLRTNAQDDRMDSFVLSETLKYLFLLFDEANPLHKDDSNYVFTTEGHILSLSHNHIKPMSSARRRMRNAENHTCPAYMPFLASQARWDSEIGLVQGIKSRPDVEYVRELAGILPGPEDERAWEPHGSCEKPQVDQFFFDYILSADGKLVPEDFNPGPEKLVQVEDGYLVQNLTGIRTRILSRLDGKGYDITKLGPHSIKTGQVIYFNDPALMLKPTNDEEAAPPARREPDVIVLVFAMPEPQIGDSAVSIVASTALFGGDLRAQTDEKPLRFGSGSGVRLARQSENPYGCDPSPKNTYDGDAVLAIRGECTFLEKLVNARNAGASGVVVISDKEHGINPSANTPELHAAGDLHDVAIVVVTKSDGELVMAMMDSVDAGGKGEVLVTVERVGEAAEQRTEKRKVESGRILHINGHPLLNTRLLV